jgi:hypothetical protein
MLHGEGKVTTVDPHPGQVLEGRGSERGVIPCLLQGSLRERLNATHVHPADGGQAEDERQHPGRGRIQPLDIVDCDHHRIGRGQRAQHSQRRDRHRSLVRWSALDLCSEERSVQRAFLRSRQIR